MFYETLILGGSCVPPVTTMKGENNMQTNLPPISMRIDNGTVFYVPPKPVWGKWGPDFDYDAWSSQEFEMFRKKSFTEAQAKAFLREYLTSPTPR